MHKTFIIRRVVAAELLLIAPLLAMLVSDDANWSVADFIFAGILLAGAGVAYHLIASGIKSNLKQVIAGIVLGLAMLLLWVEMAVGLFGSPIAGS